MDELRQALLSTGYPFSHYGWAEAPNGTYGVYAEDSARSVWGSGTMTNQLLQGTVDLFTKDDTDVPRETVQAALSGVNMAWYLNSIQFEEDTGYIHYEWVFEVV